MSQPTNDEELGKLFVGGINRQTTEDILRSYFEKYGEVSDCVLMKDKETGLSRGFGFVTYAKPQCVAEVLKQRPHTIDNKIVDPKPCTPRHIQQQKKQTTTQFNKGHKIFIGGISMEASEDDIKSYFERYGCVLEVVFVVNKADTTRPHKGFGFVTFADESSVDQACAKHYHSIKDKRVEAKRAESRDKMDKSNDQPNQGGFGGNMNYGQQPNMQGNMAGGMGYPQQQPQPQGGMMPQGQNWMGGQMMGQANYGGNQNFAAGYPQYPNQAYAGYGYGPAQGYGNMQQPQQQQQQPQQPPQQQQPPMGGNMGNMGGYGNMQPNPGMMGQQGMYPQNVPNSQNNGAMRGQGDMGNYQQNQSGYGPTKPTDYNNMGGGAAGNMGVKNDYGGQMGGRAATGATAGGGYGPSAAKPAAGNTGGGYHPYRR